MFVINRNGNQESYDTTKVQTFIKRAIQIKPHLSTVNADTLSKQIDKGIAQTMQTSDIIPYLAEVAASLATQSYEYGELAGRLEMFDLHSNTPSSFTEAMLKLGSILQDEFVSKIKSYNFDIHIDHNKDFQYDIIGIRTLKRSYLLKDRDGIVERPQYLLMRVAVFLCDSPDEAIEMYNIISEGWYTHASPTLFNSGMKQHQLASCFLMSMKDDSIEGIYDTLKEVALISKSAGGIGIDVSNIRAKGTPIKGTNGTSNGLVPMLRVFNNTARYVDQGGNKRKGSFAIYIEPWHKDVHDVLKLKLNHGVEEERARDLFYALWIPDEFMRRVEENGKWSLFCPTEAPGLQDVYGEEFDKLYRHYEQSVTTGKVINARDLWMQICTTQIETGTPYLLYKDACNLKSNQKNLGTIRGSNLCCEIVEYHDKDQTAVCTLASIALPKFVTQHGFNFDRLVEMAGIVTTNLNKVIDKTSYPIFGAEISNNSHRPIGIGVQGLSDVFQMMGLPYDSAEAMSLNQQIFEAIYYGAMKKSIALAQEYGTYTSFQGSPASKGIFQFNMWGVEPTGRFNWNELREDMMRHGLCNSLLTAPMPTASSAQILGNTESFEPRTSNLYVRRVLSGEFVIINKYLQLTCMKTGEWTPKLINKIIADKGSVQHTSLSDNIKEVFKTTWELSQKTLIDHAATRGPYIDQSQSLNLYLPNPTTSQLTSMHFYAWKKGLKTGQYYLRSQPKASPIQFTVETCDSCSA
jgi:ribonucleoside-diphosphate reductase alpha chain